MPAISPSAKVLVTGASGFVAVNVAKALLDQGFIVRGTVRSQSKGEYLKKLLGAGDNFEYAIIPDMQVSGAFDEAVKGVEAVEHIASPVTNIAGHPDEIIRPAVDGTISVLESIRKYGTSVKRVVITSSVAALGQPETTPAVVTDDVWNDRSIAIVNEQGEKAHPGLKYSASKTLAERAGWDFVKKYEQEIGWDLVTLCPSMIYGPVIQQVATFDDLNSSVKHLLSGINPPKEGDALTSRVGGWIDVRDVSKIHVLVLLEPKAGNERFITTAGGYSWQDVYDGLNEEPALPGAPVGQPGSTKGKKWDIVFSTEKLERILGKSHAELFRPIGQTARDEVISVKEQGLWDFKA